MVISIKLLATRPQQLPLVLLHFICIHNHSENMQKHKQNECRVRQTALSLFIPKVERRYMNHHKKSYLEYLTLNKHDNESLNQDE